MWGPYDNFDGGFVSKPYNPGTGLSFYEYDALREQFRASAVAYNEAVGRVGSTHGVHAQRAFVRRVRPARLRLHDAWKALLNLTPQAPERSAREAYEQIIELLARYHAALRLHEAEAHLANLPDSPQEPSP